MIVTSFPGNSMVRVCKNLLLLLATAVLLISPLYATPPIAFSAHDDQVPTLAPLIKNVAPAVVNVSIKSRLIDEQSRVLREFLGIPDETSAAEFRASGLAVIIDAANGLIVTNNHVIQDADGIRVTLTDGTELEATPIGADVPTDIALIKVEIGQLSAIPFGDSDKLDVGDFVLAIGDPFHIGQSVSSGIVSAMGRSGVGIEQHEDFIQTDAAINPGDSGGALVNLRGELVGINTGITSPSGGNIGVGFAIPINLVRSVVDQLVKYGDVKRSEAGIAVEDLPPDLRRKLGLSAQHRGAIISNVEPDSAAARVGLQVGDVITALGNSPIRSATDLRNKTSLIRAGSEADFTVRRRDQLFIVRVKLAERQPKTARASETP
jgi:serine protease Do/serine protease DegQ